MQNYIIWAIVLIALGAGGYFLYQNLTDTVTVDNEQEAGDVAAVDENGDPQDSADDETADAEDEQEDEPVTVIGTSAGGRDISAHHFGSGETELLFVGGIHGGYSWNTVLLAYELIDHLEANPDAVPDGLRVTVIPLLNPDGLATVVGTTGRFSAADVPSTQAETVPGRFNGNAVDLNRNFDCDWQADATWQDQDVSGGSAPFSEPEAAAVRDYIEGNSPDAVVVYYSAAGGVFASNCHDGVLSETAEITGVYADASGYQAYQSFDFYEITGDMVNWLAKENIPGISILLTNHTDIEWNKNRAGIEALIRHYAE